MIHGVLLSFSGIFWGFLSAIVFLATLLMAAVILIQDSKDTGLTSAFGGAGGTNALLGARMQRDLAKFTAILAVILGLCLLVMGQITKSQLGQSIGELGAGAGGPVKSELPLPAEMPPGSPGATTAPAPFDPFPAIPTETTPAVIPSKTAPGTPSDTAPGTPSDTAPGTPSDTAPGPAAPTGAAPGAGTASPADTAPPPADTAPTTTGTTPPETKKEGGDSTPRE